MDNFINYLQNNINNIAILVAVVISFHLFLKWLTGELSRKHQYEESVLRAKESAGTLGIEEAASLKKRRFTRRTINIITLIACATLPFTNGYILRFLDDYGMEVLESWPLLLAIFIALSIIRMPVSYTHLTLPTKRIV